MFSVRILSFNIFRVDKDKVQIAAEIADVRNATEEVNRSRASAEKSHKTLMTSLNDLNKRIEEHKCNMVNMESVRRRMTAENADLLSQLQELQSSANLLVQTRAALGRSLDEQKAVADNEARERCSILSKYRNMEHECEGLKQQHEEEMCANKNVSIQLEKALKDAESWKQKYTVEGMMKAEDLEMSRLKLQARLSENLNTIEQLQGKLTQLERTKAKMQEDAKEMTLNLDQAVIMNVSMEKKAKQFDRIVGDWKIKVDGLGKDLDVAQNEARSISAELFKHKNAYDEASLQLDEVRRENKTLSNEIKDIMDQITEGGRSIHEIGKSLHLVS